LEYVPGSHFNSDPPPGRRSKNRAARKRLAAEELIEAYYDSGNSVGFLYDYTAVLLLVGFASRLEESMVVEHLADLLTEAS
jgi:hypothetical protein